MIALATANQIKPGNQRDPPWVHPNKGTKPTTGLCGISDAHDALSDSAFVRVHVATEDLPPPEPYPTGKQTAEAQALDALVPAATKPRNLTRKCNQFPVDFRKQAQAGPKQAPSRPLSRQPWKQERSVETGGKSRGGSDHAHPADAMYWIASQTAPISISRGRPGRFGPGNRSTTSAHSSSVTSLEYRGTLPSYRPRVKMGPIVVSDGSRTSEAPHDVIQNSDYKDCQFGSFCLSFQVVTCTLKDRQAWHRTSPTRSLSTQSVESEEAGRSLPQWCGINLIAGKTTPLLLLEDDLIYAYTSRKSQGGAVSWQNTGLRLTSVRPR